MGHVSKKAVVCMTICLIALTLAAGCFNSDPDPRMFSSYYSSDLRMYTTGPITDVTI